MRTNIGPITGNVFSICVVFTFMTCIVCYTLVWLKVRRVSTAAGSWDTQQKKFSNMARVMTLFVLAYIGQWWPYVLQAAWGLFATPPMATIVLSVLIINLGGVYNCLAYTVIRYMYSSSSAKISRRPVGGSSNVSCSGGFSQDGVRSVATVNTTIEETSAREDANQVHDATHVWL